jgi:DHA3 family macrolide efflux protein-like MFS transporter
MIPSQKRWAISFFVLWSGQALSLLGSRVANFALIWWLTETTGSAVTLTTLMLVLYLPQIVLGPFIGVFVDRWNRRSVMLWSDTITALTSAGLALLFWQGALQPWHIYAVTFVGSISSMMQATAMSASTSLLVPKTQLGRVQGANQLLQGFMLIVAPVVGALLVEAITFSSIMALDVFTAVFAILPLFFIAIPQPRQSSTAGAPTVAAIWQDIRGGVRYIFSWRGLLLVTLFELIINLMGNPIPALLPILVTEHFSASAMQFAWLRLATGIGLLAGGFFLSLWGKAQEQMIVFPLGIIGLGIGAFLVGFAPPNLIGVAIGGTLLFGLMASLMNGTVMAVLQATVAPDLQGRVFAGLNSASMAAQPIGLLLAGPVVDRWGAPIWFIATGVVTVTVGLIALNMPAIRQLGQGPSAALHPETTIVNEARA